MSSESTESDDFSLFNHRIANDFGVCNNCFTRTHTVHEEYDPLNLPRSLRGVLKSDVERHRTTTETDHPPGYRTSETHTIWAEGNTGTGACWFKFDSSVGGDDVDSKFFVYPGEWGTHPQSVQSGDGLFSPRVDVYGDNNLPLTDSLQTGVWCHFDFTFDQPNGTISVYLNGDAVAQTTGVGAPSVERENYLLIGNSESSSEDPFHGWLDEIGIWSRILSDSEIRGLYHRGTPP